MQENLLVVLGFRSYWYMTSKDPLLKECRRVLYLGKVMKCHGSQYSGPICVWVYVTGDVALKLYLFYNHLTMPSVVDHMLPMNTSTTEYSNNNTACWF